MRETVPSMGVQIVAAMPSLRERFSPEHIDWFLQELAEADELPAPAVVRQIEIARKDYEAAFMARNYGAVEEERSYGSPRDEYFAMAITAPSKQTPFSPVRLFPPQVSAVGGAFHSLGEHIKEGEMDSTSFSFLMGRFFFAPHVHEFSGVVTTPRFSFVGHVSMNGVWSYSGMMIAGIAYVEGEDDILKPVVRARGAENEILEMYHRV